MGCGFGSVLDDAPLVPNTNSSPFLFLPLFLGPSGVPVSECGFLFLFEVLPVSIGTDSPVSIGTGTSVDCAFLFFFEVLPVSIGTGTPVECANNEAKLAVDAVASLPKWFCNVLNMSFAFFAFFLILQILHP